MFWCVQSSITHNEAVQCACAVACLCPHNSISNVVVSVTIHDITNIFLGDVCKRHETIVEGRRLFQPNIMESV